MRIETDIPNVNYPQTHDVAHISPRPEKPGSGDNVVQGTGQEKVTNKKDDAKTSVDLIKQKEKDLDINEVVKKLNETMKAFDIQLRFEVYKPTRDIVVKIYDTKDNRVIKEIPPKKVLDMVTRMLEMVGLLVDEKI